MQIFGKFMIIRYLDPEGNLERSSTQTMESSWPQIRRYQCLNGHRYLKKPSTIGYPFSPYTSFYLPISLYISPARPSPGYRENIPPQSHEWPIILDPLRVSASIPRKLGCYVRNKVYGFRVSAFRVLGLGYRTFVTISLRVYAHAPFSRSKQTFVCFSLKSGSPSTWTTLLGHC